MLAVVCLAQLPCRGSAEAEKTLAEVCKDEASCKSRLDVVTKRLDEVRTEMHGKQLTISLLEELRSGILSGHRVELPSAQRQHLEKGSPLIGEVSFDARHRPVSTNVSRHFTHMLTLGEGQEIRFHTFMPLKKQASAAGGKGGAPALIVAVTAQSQLVVFDLEGDALLEGVDLGHAPGAKVTQMVLSPSQENHFVLTATDDGEMRVHTLKVVARKKTAGGSASEAGEDGASSKSDGSKAKQKKSVSVSANFSCAFTIPDSDVGEVRNLNTVTPIERGTQIYFVTGDSLGGIGVFFRNGTLKGRARVTEDPGGVRGLMRSQGQSVLYYSSHSFGFFSVTQIDVQYPPCSGWNSPLVDVVADPSYASSRVVLALADGDVLVFSTTRGKSKACDLTLKFPHVSPIPFKLHPFKGHVLGLPTPLPETERKSDYLREIYFFNLAAMEAGYGVAPSRTVALQASFKPRQPESLALMAGAAGSGSSGSSGGKPRVAIKFEGEAGLELYDLSLKQPPAPKAAAEEGGESSNWMNWFPKIGVFGVALVIVVMWNVRKATSQRQGDFKSDFDSDYLEQLREQRRQQKGGGSGSSGAARSPRVQEVYDDD